LPFAGSLASARYVGATGGAAVAAARRAAILLSYRWPPRAQAATRGGRAS